MPNYVELETNIKSIIDDLQGLCSTNGLSNTAYEEVVVTSVFLYKFLNDKFVANLRKFCKDTGLEYESVIKNEDDMLDAFYASYPQDVAFKYEDTIDYLVQHIKEDNFYDQFDKTLVRISNYKENQSFSVETAGGEKKPLFTEICDKVEASKRNAFARNIFSYITRDRFDFGETIEGNYDFFSTIFEYLIQNYNVASGTYAEYFTPQALSSAIGKILVHMAPVEDKIYEIYDPSAGSGSLVLHLANELGNGKFGNKARVYTQDISQKSSRFLRINMLLNGLKESLENIIEGDTLETPAHFRIKGDDTSGIKKFDFITSNPPFKTDFSSTRDKIETKWEKTTRFFAGVPKIPNEKKESMPIYLCFIQHILYSLKDDGKAAIVVPSIFLTAKNGIERDVRKQIIDKKWIKGVVSMPSNIFANTGTSVSVLFIDKNNDRDFVFLADASKMGEKIKIGKNQKTVLSESELTHIVDTFINSQEESNFSVSVKFEKVVKKNYSLLAGQYFNSKINRKFIDSNDLSIKVNNFVKQIKNVTNSAPNQENTMVTALSKFKYIAPKLIFNSSLEKEIPEGWNVVSLGDCIERIATGLNPRDNFKLGVGNIKYITVKNLNFEGTLNFDSCDTIDEKAKERVHKRSDIRVGDILFASIAPLGRSFLIQEEPNDWDINESVFSIRANKKNITPEYLYMFLTSEQFIKNAEDSSTGSIFKGIRISTLNEMMIALPPMDEIIKISKYLQDLISYKKFLYNAIDNVKKMDDYFLPLLMEGQLDID